MRNKNRKTITIVFSSILILILFQNVSIFFLSNASLVAPSSNANIFFPETSQITPENIRVAIYNEPNVTQPSYSSSSTLTNNYSALLPLLAAAGFETTELTTQDIYDHKLMTADYDIFIMVDNLPKVNISDYVKEFWLGGGALIGFDSAAPYLMWAGILVPESEGDDGFSSYYAYDSSMNIHNVTLRHPITKHNQVEDTFTTVGSFILYFNSTALQGSTYGSSIIQLAYQVGHPDRTTLVALDPPDKGGKIVHLPGRGAELNQEMEDIFIEAVIWACPRVKGRILFDISHVNGYGVDFWDNPLVDYTGDRFTNMRNSLVSRDYTFDKLYPTGSDTFKQTNLAPYDLLIVNLPDTNFSASEVSAVSNWISNGGGLLALADNYVYDGVKNLNYLLSSTDLLVIDDSVGATLTTNFEHPTREGCSSLTMAVSSELNSSGDAYPLWGSSATDIGVAAQEYGNGRIILTADINLFDNSHLASTSNLQFSINVANWLTATKADILLFVNEPWSTNYYVTPAANALNILELPFYLTYDDVYLNLSLNLYDWDLVIVDEPWSMIDVSVYDTIIGYLEAGGKLVMSTYRVDNTPTHPLWSYLGFEFTADIPDTSPIYTWDNTHSIFNTPISYGANNYTPILDYGDEGDLLTVFPNATALAGFTETEQPGNATIVLRNDNKVLFNGYLIDEFSGDIDDSTYEDRLELWIAEISFIYNYGASIIPTGGIPGFDIGLFLLVTFSTIGVISIIVVRKKKN